MPDEENGGSGSHRTVFTNKHSTQRSDYLWKIGGVVVFSAFCLYLAYLFADWLTPYLTNQL